MFRPKRLITKLLIIHSVSITMVVLAIGFAIHGLAASYFMTLMQEYNISPDDAHAMFLRAIDRYLILASVIGFSVASLFSSWFYYRLISPIHQITQSARLISKGDTSLRVSTSAFGEIAHLSKTFNEMADSLEREARLRKDFVADVAHELRTPLTNLRGYMEGLRDEVIEAKKDIFVSMHEETLRLVQLVEELLQLARADVAKSNLLIEPVDLALLMEDTLNRFQLRFKERSLSVAKEIQATGFVQADKDRITQVFTNLYENACRYSPIGGVVELTLVISANAIQVTLQNDSEGNPTVDQGSLFERFQRGESSRSRQHGGAGLGLAIVKELVEAHGGSVGYQFANGKAKFWFEIPIVAQSLHKRH